MKMIWLILYQGADYEEIQMARRKVCGWWNDNLSTNVHY